MVLVSVNWFPIVSDLLDGPYDIDNGGRACRNIGWKLIDLFLMDFECFRRNNP